MGGGRIGAPAPPVRRSARVGVRAALLGAALQVAGFGWDAYMHHQDPRLAASEGVFTFTNPSHLLISLGLICCALGSVIATVGMALRLSSSRSRLRTFVVPVGILLFSLATAGVALATARARDHDHASHVHRTSAAASQTSTHGHESDADPLLARLTLVMRDEGTGPALEQLEAAVASDPGVLNRTHHIVHELGRRSFDHYRSSREAFSNCTPEFEWGCYHGVLEGYLDAQAVVDGPSIQNACPSTVDTNDANILFQCLHGLGHGLVLHLDGDVRGALTLCDSLSDQWQQTSCYSGVFMENLVEGQSAAAEGRTVEDSGLLLDPREPLYPCSELDDRYLSPCYEMAASIVLWFNGHDFTQAGATCASAPRRYVPSCYHGLGREAFGNSLAEPTKAVALCRDTKSARYARFCYAAIARNVINADRDTRRASDVCRAVPRGTQRACFAAVGQSIALLNPEPGAVVAECAAAPPAYREDCVQGARVVSRASAPAASTDGSSQ